MLPPVVSVLVADTKQYSASMAKAQAQMETFGKTGQTAGARMGAAWGKMSTAVVGGAAAVVAVSVDLAYKYNQALDSMQRQTNLTAGQMKFLQGDILTISTNTATAATTITTGYQQLIKAGESLAKSHRDVAIAAKYSAALDANLNDTLTAAIGIQKTHLAGTKSITQTLNIFDTAIKHSQLSANDLNLSLGGRALSAFAAYHVDLRSAVTLLAGFADQNLKGSKATMSLKTGVAALEKSAVSSTGKLTTQATALKSVGLNMTTLADEIHKPGGVLTVLQQMSLAFDQNASSAMKAKGIGAWLTSILGTSAGPAFTNLITELPKLQKLYASMSTSGGAVNSSFSKWLSSPAGAVAKFKTVLENSAIRLGDVLLPKLTVGLIDATKIVTGILGSPGKTSAIVTTGEVLVAAALATKVVGLLSRGGAMFGIDMGATAGAAVAVDIVGPALVALLAIAEVYHVIKNPGALWNGPLGKLTTSASKFPAKSGTLYTSPSAYGPGNATMNQNEITALNKWVADTKGSAAKIDAAAQLQQQIWTKDNLSKNKKLHGTTKITVTVKK